MGLLCLSMSLILPFAIADLPIIHHRLAKSVHTFSLGSHESITDSKFAKIDLSRAMFPSFSGKEIGKLTHRQGLPFWSQSFGFFRKEVKNPCRLYPTSGRPRRQPESPLFWHFKRYFLSVFGTKMILWNEA